VRALALVLPVNVVFKKISESFMEIIPDYSRENFSREYL
jgi:hypothetical protein